MFIFAEPPEKIKYAGYTWRKDRYFFICGGCVIDDTDECTYTDNCYMLDLAIGKKKVNSYYLFYLIIIRIFIFYFSFPFRQMVIYERPSRDNYLAIINL